MKGTLKIVQRLRYVSKNGTSPICLRYTAYRKVAYIGLNISVNPKYWSDDKGKVLVGEKNHLLYNRIISEQYARALMIINDNFTKALPAAEFVCKFKDKTYGNTDFYVFVEKELEFLKLSRAKGTISNYYSFINTMKEWKTTLTFDEITLEFIQSYHEYELKSGNLLNTIYKKHANFKFFIGLAVDKGFMDNNPYGKFKIKK